MENQIQKRCCFIGHREIEKSAALEDKLYKETEKLINEGVDTFLFGSKSEFNRLCYNTVTRLKEKYPHIKRVYVRAEYPDINDDYTEYLLKSCEETYYPDKIRGAGRAAYVERNYHMINQCFTCVFYYKEGYLPHARRDRKQDLKDFRPKSGTEIAYAYAVKNNKK